MCHHSYEQVSYTTVLYKQHFDAYDTVVLLKVDGKVTIFNIQHTPPFGV
jgi:hypothetical protein